jgi:hypothetical protein
MSKQKEDDSQPEIEEVNKIKLLIDKGENLGEEQSLEDEGVDDSGKILQLQYEYYDILYQCWRSIKNHVNDRGIPLCEYMTIHNFLDFVDKM